MNLLDKKKIDRAAIGDVREMSRSAARMEMALKELEPDAYQLAENAFWTVLLRNIGRLHYSFDELAIRNKMLTPNLNSASLAEARSVQAKAIGGDLYLKCPHPPVRRKEYDRTNQQAISHAISSVLDQLTLYPRKQITVVNVYETKKAASGHLLDFDNYDLKNLIDEVCRVYPGNDSPVATSIYLKTIFSDEIPALTYLLVTPNEGPEDLALALKHAFLD